MDDMRFSALFNSQDVPIISGRWEGDNQMLCANVEKISASEREFN